MVVDAGGDDHQVRRLIRGGDVFLGIVAAFADASRIEEFQQRAFLAGKGVLVGKTPCRAENPPPISASSAPVRYLIIDVFPLPVFPNSQNTGTGAPFKSRSRS